MVTHIIHIADLHIRTGDPERARIAEYTHVFDGLVADVRRMTDEHRDTREYITVIAGDIFHNKGRIESAGFKLFSQFLHALSDITPVFFICGNHDFRQEDPTIPDMLESMLDPWKTHRIQYFKETGRYEYKNVGFGVVSVKDTLRIGNTTGARDALPTYPSPDKFGDSVQHRIALFHGHGFPMEWFKGYEYLLLGDIHKQHTGTTPFGMKWGYPGSLVQQDHGETVFGHGYLLWDLQTSEVTQHHVPNMYGMVTMRVNDQGLYVHMKGRDWVSAEDVCQDPAFPRRPTVRLLASGTGSSLNAQHILESYDVIPRTIRVMSQLDDVDEVNTDMNTSEKEIDQLAKLCSPDKWKEYIQSVTPNATLESWLYAPESMNIPKPEEHMEFPSSVHQKISERINKFVKYHHEYAEMMGSDALKKRNTVILKHMHWDYTLCYGEENHIDFSCLNASIALLNGKNATGKSSFLDVLCLGLFGEQTRTRFISGKKMTAKLIHNKKPPNKKAMNVRVVFSVNDVLYEVVREFGVQSDKANISQFGVGLYQLDVATSSKVMLREGVSAVNAWIESNVGTVDSVLLSNFITQTDNNNFFALKQDEQKQLMEKALHLETVTALGNLIHEAKLGHTYAIGQVSAVVETTKRMNDARAVEPPDTLAERISRYEERLQELYTSRDQCMRIIGENADDTPSYDQEHCEQRLESTKMAIDAMKDVATLIHENPSVQQEMGVRQGRIKILQEELQAVDEVDVADCFGEEYDENDIETAHAHASHQVADVKSREPELPVIPKDMIEEMNKEYTTWYASQPSVYTEGKKDLLQDVATRVLQHIVQPAIVSPSAIEIGSMQDALESMHEYTETKKELDAHVVYSQRESEYKLWTKQYTQWLERYQSVVNTSAKTLKKNLKRMYDNKRHHELQVALHALDEELKTFSAMPYNDECWACKQQPWRTHFHQRQTKANDIREQMAHIVKACTDTQPVTEDDIHAAEELVRMRSEYDTQLQQWQDEYEGWNEWKTGFKRFKKLRVRCQELENALWTFKQTHKHLPEFLQHHASWERQLSKMRDANVLHLRHDVWKQEYQEVCDTLDRMTKCKTRIRIEEELDVLQTRSEIDGKKAELCAKWQELHAEKMRWEQERAKVILHKTMREIRSLEAQLNTARMEYGHSQAAYDKFVKINKLLQEQQTYLEELKERETLLKQFEDVFVGDGEGQGYKTWIYTTKVLPLLQRELNACLRTVDTIRMKISFDKGMFLYTVEDGERKPSLDKASGYQNFIISMCMRITLGRIGASHHNIRHLIIDEGFTSCDADNLTRMPMFMTSLLKRGDYDSILLMSHLDGIRESVSHKIDIHQQGCFSIVRHGEPYPTFTVRQEAQPARKGRPPKKIPA